MKIKNKNIKIGKLNIITIDWFEICKYLAVISGIFISISFFSIYKVTKVDTTRERVLFGGIAVCCFILFYIIGYSIELISESNRYI